MMVLGTLTILVMSVLTFYISVGGEVTNIRLCSYKQDPSARLPSAIMIYNFSVNLFCNEDCEVTDVKSAMWRSGENCTITKATNSTHTNVQVKTCQRFQACSDGDLARQHTICNFSINARSSVVVLYSCSTSEVKPTDQTTVQNSESTPRNRNSERTTRQRNQVTFSTTKSSFQVTYCATSVVVIALSVIICVLLIVVTVVIIWMCSLKKRLSQFKTAVTKNATPENYDRLESIHQPRASVIYNDDYMTPV